MNRPVTDTIEINCEEKRITITDHKPLYRFIKSGAVLVAIPTILESLEQITPAVDGALRALTAFFEIIYLYIAQGWNLVAEITASIQPGRDADRGSIAK